MSTDTGTGHGAEIVGIEYALPARIVTNADLEREYPAWDMPAVARKTGVVERHVAAEGECASDLAFQACERLLAATGVRREEVDGLLVCTQSPDFIMPPTSAILQRRLGLPTTVAAFDYTLACSGFVYGLAISRAFIESGILGTVLLVTCDTYSKYIRPDDRATRTLFGDGAAATLIRRGRAGIGHVELGTDGSGAEAFIVREGGCRVPSTPGTSPTIAMDGLAVLGFVKREVPGLTHRLLRRGGVTRDDVDLFVFHQASQVSLDVLASSLEIPPSRLLVSLTHVGNNVSSSIPMGLRDAWAAGRLKPGMLLATVGFGVGFSWGGALLRWTAPVPADRP